MARYSANCAVLFADIARSTQLYEVLGDKIANRLIKECISILSKTAVEFHGSVIKTIGDEILCTFVDANDAVRAGKAMHEATGQFPILENPAYIPPNIYVGIHFGPIIEENNDIFGDTVNVAARIVAMAKQRQIITTEKTVDLLSNELVRSAKYLGGITAKGKSGEIKVFEVVWEQQELTVQLDDIPGSLLSPRDKAASLVLRYHDNVITVDVNRPIVTLGRQMHNDIVVIDIPVSRSHARIEYRGGRFLLIDESTNGTYLNEHGKKRFLKHSERYLIGDGIISLGKMPDPNLSFSIHYHVETSLSEPERTTK
jgi:class 3 adenylate cyclase